jgi:hypothetical protein
MIGTATPSRGYGPIQKLPICGVAPALPVLIYLNVNCAQVLVAPSNWAISEWALFLYKTTFFCYISFVNLDPAMEIYIRITKILSYNFLPLFVGASK